MKKVILLAVLLTAYSNLFAFLTQGNWRWRKDDGSETNATWIAAQNTPITIASTDSTLRLRIEVFNTQADSIELLDTLQYATSASGPWTNITTTVGTHAFVLAMTSPYVHDSEATTEQLTGVSKPFHPGLIIDSSLILRDSLAPDYRSEYEWCIKPTPNLQPNTTYYFQHWGSTAQRKSGTPFPTLTTAATLPIGLSSFSVKLEGKRVSLQWTTVSEQNNDHFDVERSVDGSSWTRIASIKGSGTSSQTHTYEVYDNAPVAGTSYYRIKQFDADGSFTTSDIKSLKMVIVNAAALKIIPNPAHGDINFSLPNYSGKLTVTLSTISGKVIHQEVFESTQVSNKLNLDRQPAPGLYILKVTGDGISESTKVVIQ